MTETLEIGQSFDKLCCPYDLPKKKNALEPRKYHQNLYGYWSAHNGQNIDLIKQAQLVIETDLLLMGFPVS